MFRGAAPSITIAAPPDGLLTNQTPIPVTGSSAGSPAPSVTVNGVAASTSGTDYSASVGLVEGANTLTASAENEFGTAQASVTVTLDTTPPVVTIETPADGYATTDGSVVVTGTVADASPIASFTVNGVATPLVAGTFTTTISLAEGANPITAVATDAGSV